ncbi:MAG: mitochondrial 37S ribosomal protein rsm10 [Thelocarpon superellum]|nr:MAG: mitochondrial 37S ribosomal protein rsm10 [Thelocarpon superellum]
MAFATCWRCSVGISKRLKLHNPLYMMAASFSPARPLSDTPVEAQVAGKDRQVADPPPSLSLPPEDSSQASDLVAEGSSRLRLPRSVQAVYLRPLKRRATYGVPTCDLQLRSYSVRNVEFFADFALRAAYYLDLPASGPVPLPRIVNRWTVPRSNFVNKKSQENFERVTLRRLVQIQDGNPEVVEIWLSFLRKYQYHGVGMKANVWNYERLGVGKTMDVSLENVKHVLDPKWAHFGRKKNLDTSEKVMEMLGSARFDDVGKEISKSEK